MVEQIRGVTGYIDDASVDFLVASAGAKVVVITLFVILVIALLVFFLNLSVYALY